MDLVGDQIKGADVRICADNKMLRTFRPAATLDAYVELRQPFYPPPPEAPYAAFKRATDALTRATEASGHPAVPVPAPFMARSPAPAEVMEWDVFIAHATADQEPFVREFAEGLETAGFTVWYAPFALKWGDSLRRKIEEGLANSRWGIVVLSPNFFAGEWPQAELDGLTQRQNAEGRTVILPILHNITIDEVRKRSPMLADRLAIPSERGIAYVVDRLRELME